MSSKAPADRIPPGVLFAALLLSLCLAPLARAADANGDEEDGPPQANVYFDFRTTFTALPPGVLAVGLSRFPRLQLSSEASKVLTFDFPLTIDITEAFSLYGGPTASTSRTTTTPWRQMTLDSWNIGFQSDVYQQNGGWFPTVTIQSTLTRSIPETLLSATSTTTIAELGYALDEDETRGWLAGVQYTNTWFDSNLPQVKPAIVGYIGGYHQFDTNWKLTGRAGVQSFGGANLLTIEPIRPFTKPVLRLDLEKLDDGDNRVFGITAEAAWAPKLVVNLVIRTPLYLVKN